MYSKGIQNNSHVNVFRGDMENTLHVNQNKYGRQKRNSIYAGGLKTVNNNQAEIKKSLAQKQAFKLVSDQFSKDNKMDDCINERIQNQEKLINTAEAACKEANLIRDKKQELMDSYGITENSKEHKDLELLRKSERNPENLTEEEKAYLQEMDPITDYQKTMLEYDSIEEEWMGRAKDAMDAKNLESRIIEGLKIEMSKYAPMVDAQKDASEMMAQASKEAVGMLLQDGIEQVGERLEEAKELAEKQKEAKEEKEERLKEDDYGATPVEEAVQDRTDELDELERKLQNIVNENNLTMEDLKGIAVDRIT